MQKDYVKKYWDEIFQFEMNVTIHHFQKAKKHEEIGNAYTFTNTKYKNSLVYGAKIILVSRLVYVQLKSFVTLIRPVLTDGKTKSSKLRFIFTSSAKPKDREFL